METPDFTNEENKEISKLINQPLAGTVPEPEHLSKLISVSREKSLKEAAMLDPLTKLLNRRAFEQRVTELVATYNRESIGKENPKKYALLALDIDHFKSINDTYGHDVGDAVLKRAAEIFKEKFRITDTIARFGGEEFYIILNDVNYEQIIESLSRDRGDTGPGLSFQIELGEAKEEKIISFSGGLVPFIPSENHIDDVIKKADVLLYKAKQSGRNKINPDETIIPPKRNEL